MQECYNDACYYRDQLRAQFFYGNATLRQRGLGEAYYWHILSRISRMLAEMETIPEDLRELSCSMVDLFRQFFPVPVSSGFLGHPPAFPRDASAPFE